MFGLKSSTALRSIVKFNSPSRTFTLRRSADDQEEIQLPIVIMVDFPTSEKGYINYIVSPPSKILVPLTDPDPGEPEEVDDSGKKVFTEAFVAKVMGDALPGVCEWTTTSKLVGKAWETLYKEYCAAPEAADGKIPLVRIAGTKTVMSGKTTNRRTNFVPDFRIIGWVDRPNDFGEMTCTLPVRTHIPARTKPTVPPSYGTSTDLRDEIPF